MSAPQTVIRLVETFLNNIESLKSTNYNETQVRREYIDPFFEALGWDVFNKSGYAEAYKDVIHEYSQKTTDTTKNPDYCFRIGGKRKFFVEAKKPSVNLKDDIHPAYQLRRYGWSAKLPLCILTDFEEFAVYDCRIQPRKNDKASTARVMFLTYEDYINKWDELVNIFSKDAVLKGSFDKYSESNKKKRGTADVDEAFLKEMEEWRNLLARNIALRNTGLSIRELNFAVQKTIDRIIFLRICEDRGIENYGQLMNLLNGTNVYERLKQIFTRADEKYNSGLFHFEKEKDRNDPPDEITPTLQIDDKTLKDIIKKLYYPESPYEFSVLPADILGHVYEQFLGKVIRLTPAHFAVVEDKPEVKKAGGVYYTPTYIVDYIVKNTVGKILEEIEHRHSERSEESLIKNTIKEISKIKILDPACGSGSFLLGAYQYLLDWHLTFYTNSVKRISDSLKKKIPPIYQIRKDEYRLTTTERKRILLNNIYGVDIDSQAVEVTKLSLLLKVLEGESEETLTNQMKMFLERALPNLANNIKCGNSLIGPDFYDQMEMNFLNDEEKLRINVFDWKAEFPDIFKASGPAHRSPKDEGGFDVVIGNPPWGVNFTNKDLNYLKQKNSEIIVRIIDSFMFFTYRSSSLLNNKGLWSMILPDVILYQNDNKKLRQYILSKFKLLNILNLGDVFKAVTRPSCVIVFQNIEESNNNISVGDFNSYKRENKSILLKSKELFDTINQSFYNKLPNNILITKNKKYYTIWNKVSKISDRIILDFVDDDGIQRGASPDLKEAFIIDKKTTEKYNLELSKLKPVLTGGKQVKRYFINDENLLMIYMTKKDDINNYPNIKKYISLFKEKITCKEVKQNKHSLYVLHRSRKEEIFTKKHKVLGVITSDKIIVAKDFNYRYSTDGLFLFGLKNEQYINFIVAILNSKLLNFLYKLLALESGRVLAQVKPILLAKLPVADIANEGLNNFNNLVVQLENLYLKQNISKTPTEKTALQRQINATDKQIDKLVYQLYNLTEKEIKIVEKT